MMFRSLVIMPALAFALSGAAYAEDYKVEGLLAVLSTGKSMELETGHTVWLGVDHATFFSAEGERGIFDKVSNKCTSVGDIDTNNKKVIFGGYCVQGNDGENQAFFRWSCEAAPGQPCSGTDEYIGGTGKYRGITGKVNFVGHPIRDWKDGTSTVWSSWTGQVTIPR
jgi:hypothetical protein